MSPTQRQVLVIAFDGTHCDSVSPNSRTIITTITNAIEHTSRRVHIRLISGIGAGNSLVAKYIEGALGKHQSWHSVLEATYHLNTHYQDGDEVIVIGYSRGAAIARSFVGFLDRVGLPTNPSEGIIHKLYNEYISSTFPDPGIVPQLNQEAKGRPVSIQTLLCIDSVESLGVPRKGIFAILEMLPFLGKSATITEPVAASNVRVLLQAFALHETRAVFEAHLMYVDESSSQILEQVYFPGTHGSIARETKGSSLTDYVFAWAVAKLEKHTSLTFDEAKLLHRLPQMSARIPLNYVTHRGWPNDIIKQSNKGLWRLFGKKARIPYQTFRPGMRTNEVIHITARSRGYGVSKHLPAVPGYEPGPVEGGPFYWREIGGNGLVHEAAFTEREGQLLGITFD